MPESIPWAPERALEGPKGPEVRVLFNFSKYLSFFPFFSSFVQQFFLGLNFVRPTYGHRGTGPEISFEGAEHRETAAVGDGGNDTSEPSEMKNE